MQSFLLTVAAWVLAATAPAANWTRVGSTEDGTVYYVDKSRVRQVGQYLSAWSRWDNTANASQKSKEDLVLYHYDCATGKRSVKEAISYGYRPEDIRLYKPSANEMAWSVPTPGSVGEAAFEAICGTPKNIISAKPL